MAEVAVIGAGVAGLTAAYVLQRKHDVTLFEADDRLGGHAHTHDLGGVAVDSGFIVHNERTYPNLIRLFRELQVSTQDSETAAGASTRTAARRECVRPGTSGWTGDLRRRHHAHQA